MVTDKRYISQFETMALDRSDIEKMMDSKQMARSQSLRPPGL